MADNFQLDEIPIPRAAPVEAQLAPIVQNTEWQARQAQARVEEPPKAWGMPGAGFAGKGAGAANIADSILRGLIAGKTAAALTMAKQTMAEVGTATQRHRVNEESYRNAKLATMDPTTMENPEARDKAAAALATAEQNLRDSQNMMLQVYGKHAGLTERKPGQKEGGIGSKIVRGMAGAFKAKDPTSAAIQIAYSMMPAGEDMPMPAIDPLAATKARILGTAAKGGEQQLEVGKQQLKIGEQQFEVGKLTLDKAQKTATAMDQHTAAVKQVQTLVASGKPETDPEVKTAQMAADNAADIYASYSSHPIAQTGTRQFERQKLVFEMGKTNIGMSVLRDATAAQQKAANKQPLTPYEKSALATITGIQTAPQDLWNGYLAQYGDDPAKARAAMIRDQIRVAQASHQPSAATNAMWAIRADLTDRLGRTPSEGEVARQYQSVFGKQGAANYRPLNDFTANRARQFYIQKVIDDNKTTHPEWADMIHTINPGTATGSYTDFKPAEAIPAGHWYGGTDQRPSYQDFKLTVAAYIQAKHDEDVANGIPTYHPGRIAPTLFGAPPPTVANAPGRPAPGPSGTTTGDFTGISPTGYYVGEDGQRVRLGESEVRTARDKGLKLRVAQ